MKVYLGKYVYPITTYDIASKIIFWDNTKYRKKLNSILKFGLTYNQKIKNYLFYLNFLINTILIKKEKFLLK